MLKHYEGTAYATRTLRVKITKGKVGQVKRAANMNYQLSKHYTVGSKHAR